MTKVKTVEIKEVAKKKSAWDLVMELESTGFALEELYEVLTLVIEFFDEQHKADLNDPFSCYGLVTFTQRYNTVLKMARDKVESLDANIKNIVREQ
ncbi:MAG: hypothetical protein Q3988_01100 [Gemella sp.]|nr:hypothetical protein [Gemella sp.]